MSVKVTLEGKTPCLGFDQAPPMPPGCEEATGGFSVLCSHPPTQLQLQLPTLELGPTLALFRTNEYRFPIWILLFFSLYWSNSTR